MMSPRRNDVIAPVPLILQAILVQWMCVSGVPTKDADQTHYAAACYGIINNYLRLHCPDDKVIQVLKVIQGAKLKSSGCITPANELTYNRTCCQPSASDCKIEVHDNLSTWCNGQPQCEVMAGWSVVSNHCDQDIYPFTITYMQADYACVRNLVTRTTSDGTTGTSPTTNTSSTNGSSATDKGQTTRPGVVVVSTVEQDSGDTDIGMSDAIIGAILAGSLGMLLTLLVFIIYWRRKRKLRIIGKPQTSVWDYLLNQTFTVRGERGYDHFSSCRSSVGSDCGEPKSPVFRKTLWLPNISPVEDTQSDVFNDTDTVHNLELHQVGTSNPYAFLSLAVNNNNNNSNNNINDSSNNSNSLNSTFNNASNSTHDA